MHMRMRAHTHTSTYLLVKTYQETYQENICEHLRFGICSTVIQKKRGKVEQMWGEGGLVLEVKQDWHIVEAL